MDSATDFEDRPSVPGCGPEKEGAPAHRADPGKKTQFGLVEPARGLVRFLYSSNPFYVLSADLVFVGLRASFGPGGQPTRTAVLIFGLAAYTLLLAASACVVIRIGKLWDDLRSILLLIVMILMAIAMSGDDVMAADAFRGTIVCLGGFFFASAVSEAVLRGIRLRLPGWYRAAYYLILALIFLYPIALAPFLSKPESPGLQWAIFGFSPLAGLALMALVPAARAGREYVARNGSPWRWPLFPWSLFLVLAVGLAVRSSSLCVSFHFVGGHQTIFGPYFLVPIGIAVSLIWLEIGIASGRRSVMFLASATPLGLAVLAMTGHRYEPVYQHFLALFVATLGASPAFLSLIAATMFLVYAARRGAPLAWELVTVSMIALGVVGPATVDAFGLVAPRWPPLAAAGLVLGIVAWRREDSTRAFLAAGLVAAATSICCGTLFPHAELGVVWLHVTVIAVLTVAAIFDDPLALVARSCGALVLLVLGLASATGYGPISRAVPAEWAAAYPVFIAAVACGYGFVLRDHRYLAGAVVNLAAWLGCSGWQVYAQIRKAAAGLDQIVWGLVFFSIAMAISLRKAGVRTRFLAKPLAKLLEIWHSPGWRVRHASRMSRLGVADGRIQDG
jgi:hypothetical protein